MAEPCSIVPAIAVIDCALENTAPPYLFELKEN